jgi:hypothetical protein
VVAVAYAAKRRSTIGYVDHAAVGAAVRVIVGPLGFTLATV